ncbi:hypothetical protein MHYP_G00102370 [Metynnis hypsauchen]
MTSSPHLRHSPRTSLNIKANLMYHPLAQWTELHVEAPEEVREGETADLTCNTTCSLTDPTFIWYKDGRPLTTKTIKNNQLHLQTVSSEDAGSYSCAGRGSQHLHSTAHSLRVRYPPKRVSVSISPSGEIVEGSSVTLTCSSDGYPPVKIYTWFKGSTPVGEGKTYSIPNIRSEDSGDYTCQSRNDHGERRSTAVYLNVLYPPKNVSVFISSSGHILVGFSVNLTCSSDGNPPVQNYTWFKEGGTSPVGSGHSYSPLQSGSYYCEAQNQHGAQRSDLVPVDLKNTGLRVKPPDDDSCSVNVYENVTKAGLRAPPPDDDSSSAQDYENLTGSGLNAPPPDDDSSSTDDYENITDDYENVTALEATAPPPRENLTEEKDAAIKHLMKTLLDEVGIRTEQLLNLQVSSNKDVADAIGELLETLFDDALLASLQPLENKIMDTNQVETEEDTQEKHLDHPVSSNKDVADAIGELLETLFDDALLASLQPLADNKIMDTNLAETEEDTQEKHLDHLVSSNKDVADAIGELLEIMFDDALSASLQPLDNKIMDTNLAETEEDTQEKHLDHLVSSNKDVADAIGELLETLFDDVLLASLQPLENKIMDTNQAETEEDTQEKHLGK